MADEVEHQPMRTRTKVITTDDVTGFVLYKARCSCGHVTDWERRRKTAEDNLAAHLRRKGVGVDQ